MAALIADLSAVIALTGSSSVRVWLREHYLVVSIVCAFAIAITLLLLNHYPKTVSQLREELERKQAIIAQPTKRDQDAFSCLLEELPLGSGVMGSLAYSFFGKSWTRSDFHEIRSFTGNWRERFFDDSIVDQSFRDLWASFDELSEWMAIEGEPCSDSGRTYRTIRGRDRPGGHQDYDAARNKGEEIAWKIIEARRTFERSGRERGL